MTDRETDQAGTTGTKSDYYFLAAAVVIAIIVVSFSLFQMYQPGTGTITDEPGYIIEGSMITYPVTDSISIRFYRTPEPSNGKISELHKGAVLVYNGVETIGEGAGFGGVVMHHNGTDYFSKSADTEIRDDVLVKIFHMDSTEDGDPFETEFVDTDPMGSVQVTYNIDGTTLHVTVKPLDLPVDSTLYILNEQSGEHFYRYTDLESTDNLANFTWEEVPFGNNYLLSEDGMGFGLDYIGEVSPGPTLYLGREVEPEGFDWAGFELIIDSDGNEHNKISYDIMIKEPGFR
jgi:hypothetical protein